MAVLLFFNDTATTEIYTLSLHDALPISGDLDGDLDGAVRVLRRAALEDAVGEPGAAARLAPRRVRGRDRKSTRLNSSHANISYAVFCLKKKHESANTQQPLRRDCAQAHA